MVASSSLVRKRRSPASRLVTALVAAVCLVLGPLAFAPAQAAENGSISGTVVDAESDELLQAASILIRPADDDNAQPITADAPDGAFTIPDLPAGEYTVEIRDVSGEHLPEFYDDAQDITAAKVVVVTAGADTPLGAIGLDEGASLSGTVQTTQVPAPGEPDHIPVAHATVVALPVVNGQVDRQHAASTSTGTDGTFSITDLRAGTYKLKVSAPGYFDGYSGSQPSEQLATSTTVDAGDDGPVGTIVIEQTAGIIGTVANASGGALAGVSVDAYPVTGGAVSSASAASAVTAANGSFAVRPLHAGEYRLRFRDATGAYQERFDTDMTVEGGENQADASVIVLPAVVPPAPYAPPVVAKKSASIKVSAKGGKKKATLTITVKASGVTPTGRVTIKLGNKTLKTVTLKHGRATITLKKQKKGKRTYKVLYAGDSKVRAKTVNSKKVNIR